MGNFWTSSSNRQENTHIICYCPIGFTSVRGRVEERVYGRKEDRRRVPGEAVLTESTSQQQLAILHGRPEEINSPPFQGGTRVKHAQHNQRVKPCPQGGQRTCTTVGCDTDNCPPPPLWRQTLTPGARQSKTTSVGRPDRDTGDEEELSRCPEWGTDISE